MTTLYHSQCSSRGKSSFESILILDQPIIYFSTHNSFGLCLDSFVISMKPLRTFFSFFIYERFTPCIFDENIYGT